MTPDRTHLPYAAPLPPYDPPVDVRDQQEPFPKREPLEAPEKAPNVLLVLLDDMGFGAPSAFGGPCATPVAEELAENGLRYSRFHTTALCSPTRAALLSGRNHHSVGMGSVTNVATAAPGRDGMRQRAAATLAQTLRFNGYATGAFGKWHQTPPWEATAAGPFDRWPTYEGFEKFYGFLGGEDNQFTPHLFDGTTPIEPPVTPEEGYHFSEDIVDRAQDWVREVKTFAPDKPWFTYLPFGATHAPFHVPEEWRGRNRGAFAHGWDRQREITLERQKELGVVPPDTELAPWAPGPPHWDELDDAQRESAERLIELYADFTEHTDAQIGRFIEFLRERGELDNTIVLYVLGDNGASAEGGFEGTINEGMTLNGTPDSADRVLDQGDELGGPWTFPHFNSSWALAMCTPYQWTKQVASHYGGTRNGLVVHWPAGIESSGEIRDQWHHVIDVAPTLFEAIGVPQPETVDGVDQDPIEGTSFFYTFDDSSAPERHLTQYFEMSGNRGIYHEGWTAVAQHRTPWNLGETPPALADDTWELYDTNVDWSQAHDLAAEQPEKLAELQEVFLAEARKYNVLPLDDRGAVLFDPELAGRPSIAGTSLVLTRNMGRLPEDAVPNVKNSSYRLTAKLTAAAEDSDGVLVAQGGRFSGWAFYVKQGFPVFAYNLAGSEYTYIRGDSPIGTGQHTVEFAFDYDGGGIGKGGDGRLYIDGAEVGQGRIERTTPFFISLNESLNVGIDRGTPVTEDYSRGGGNPYTGDIDTVTISTGNDGVGLSRAERIEADLRAD
jgi:arylsulfatase A-like enzyme